MSGELTGIISKLAQLGYSLKLEGENLKATYVGLGIPDPSQVRPLLEALWRHKPEAVAYLQGQEHAVRCRNCKHAEVGTGYALCRGPAPWDGIPGQTTHQAHPCPGFKQRVGLVAEAGSDIPSCNTCPWCLDNHWTHYPDLPKWCGYWWDHLLADNPQCRDRREGRVPDPRAGNPRARKTIELVQPNHAATNATCFECAHFAPARSSPNPTQAWGECRRLEKGRYGVARACDAFQKARHQDSLSTTASSGGSK